MYTIRYALVEDKEFCLSLDQHLSLDDYIKKVKTQTIYILEVSEEPIGVLRYNLFWDNIPFLNLIYIDESKQSKGYGKLLVDTWEMKMKQLGYDFVMTSTQENESAKDFYKRLGYKVTGDFTLNLTTFKEPKELLFVKEI